MRVSVLQMNSGDDKAANIEAARRLIAAAVGEDRAELVVLPEVWHSMGGTTATRRASAERLPGGDCYRMLQESAREHGIYLHGGSFFEAVQDSDKIYNTTVAFGPDGRELARYRKIHLFDITAPDGREYRESAVVGRGQEIVLYDAGELRVGCSICYDVRFGELYRALAARGAELITVPAAFTLQTGKDHWEVLLRARAIETQCYVLAAAQWGPYRQGEDVRYSYGHAMIVDPWGQVIAQVADGVGFATARLDRERLRSVRRAVPVAEHRVLSG